MSGVRYSGSDRGIDSDGTKELYGSKLEDLGKGAKIKSFASCTNEVCNLTHKSGHKTEKSRVGKPGKALVIYSFTFSTGLRIMMIGIVRNKIEGVNRL